MAKLFSLALLPKLLNRDLDGLVALGDKCRDKRKWKQAAAAYRAVVQHDAQNGAIWMQLGHAYKEANALDLAGPAYLEALALSPNDPDCHLQLGHYFKICGQLERAGESYIRALELSPDLDHAYDELQQIGWSETEIIKACPAILKRRLRATNLDMSKQSEGEAFMKALVRSLACGQLIDVSFGQ